MVLDAIRRTGPVSRATVGMSTGLTPQTVTNIAGRLLGDGLVREAGASAGARGAPGRLLEIDPDGCFAVGLHLDPARLVAVLLDLAGRILTVDHGADGHLDDPEAAITSMAAAVERVLTHSGVDRSRCIGIGIAVPGPIDAEGTRVESPSQLRAWTGIPLADLLRERTGLPAHLEKDGVASAIGELWTIGGAQDLVSAYLGHGVSAAVVVGGEVLRGATGNAGEFGGMPVEADGSWTDLWRVCQPLPVVRRAVDLGLLPSSILVGDAAEIRAAYERVCRIPEGAPLIARSGAALGSALSHVVELLDVSCVVVGGSTALAGGATLLDALERRLAERLPRRRITVSFTETGEDAVARGAACAVLRSALAPSALGLGLPSRAAAPGADSQTISGDGGRSR